MQKIIKLLFPKNYLEKMDPAQNEVITVIGSGGKTTLVWLLAEAFRREKTLVSTTVNMSLPQVGQFDFFFNIEELEHFVPQAGITFAGRVFREEHVSSLPLEVLESLFPRFEKAVLESDGSRCLPFKAWAVYEPVVPQATTLTIGLMPVPLKEYQVSEEHIHRLPIFCDITGAKPGEALKPEHLAAVISHPQGLVARSKGRKVLFFNKVESPEAEEKARLLFSLLPDSCREQLWAVLAGSVLQNKAMFLQKPLGD